MKCVYTVVDDGSHFFDVWYRYYSRFFDEKDIYILDIGKGVATKNLNCNIAYFDCDITHLKKLSAMVNDYKSKLLKKYEWIVFADNDEIIYYPDGLDTYINELEDDYATCRGYDIIQSLRTECVRRGQHMINLFTENSMDWSKPVLTQRRYWQSNTIYNKTPITRVDFTWSKGQHRCDRADTKNDSGLLLLHLKMVDYNYGELLNKKVGGRGSGDSTLSKRPLGDAYRRWWLITSQKIDAHS